MPSLDLDFLSGTLDSRVSFSRASMAWQTDATGTLTTAPHNLLTHSDFFANSAWVKTACTIVANNAAAPDGTMTADTITFSSGTGLMRQTVGAGVVVAGTTYTFSMWVRLVSGSASINIDINDGTGTNITVTTSWSRISWTAAAGAGSGGWIDFRSNAAAVWEIWGAQLEQHPSARPYLSTGVKNLIGFSDDLSVASWAKNAATITANNTVSPNGDLTADTFVPSVTNTTHYVQSNTIPVVAGATYTLSFYLKAAGYNWVRLFFSGVTFPNGNRAASFNLATGTVGATASGVTARISDAGNGWYRCSITAAASSTGSDPAGFALNTVDTFALGSFAGDGTSGVHSWGAQMSASGSLDTYSPNAAAAPTSATYHGPRFDYNAVTKAARGLLVEEARTNLAAGTLTGGTYWTGVGTGSSIASGATAPDGTTNGVTVTEGGTVTSYGLNQASTVTITASSPVTASIFVKAGTSNWYRMLLINNLTPTVAAQAWFDVTAGTVGTVNIFTQAGGVPTGFSASIQDAGGGWWRCSLTATLATATTAAIMTRIVSSDAVSSDVGGKTMSFWGPQLEVGAFATSYIPTTTAAVTRAADTPSIPTLAGWYNATEGTLFAEVETPSQAAYVTTGVSFGLSSGAFGDSVYLSHTNNGDYMGVTSSGTTVATAGYGTIQGGVRRVAGAYKLNDFALSRAGAAPATDTSGTVSATATAASVGKAPWAAGNYLNGYIRRVRYWPTRRPNAELQTLTS
jgi:hypothetical protein